MRLTKVEIPLDVPCDEFSDDVVCGKRIGIISEHIGTKVLILDWHKRETLCWITGKRDHTTYEVMKPNGERSDLCYHDLYDLYLVH